MQTSDILIPLSSLAALLLPGILKADHFSAWANGIIATVVVALFAGATVWAGGQFTGNVAADWALFAAAYSALLSGPLAPLDKWLQSALNLPWVKSAQANVAPTAIPLPQVPPPQQ